MNQVEYQGEQERFGRDKYANFFSGRNDSFCGFDFNFLPRATFDDSPEERHKTYQGL